MAQVDQKNCFGQVEHRSIDQAVTQDRPTMGPFTLWKHSQTSQVIQGTVGRSTQDRGAQQGAVAGSFEASATLAEQARDTKALIPQAQSDGTLPWATTPTDPQTLQNRRDEWLRTVRCRQAWLQLPPSVRRQQTLDHNAQDPYDSIHPDGGLVDVWIMDDQTIVGDPALTNPLIDAVDITCQDPKRGRISNCTKTHVIIYASQDQIQQHQLTWNLAALQGEATLNTPPRRTAHPWSHPRRRTPPTKHIPIQTQCYEGHASPAGHHQRTSSRTQTGQTLLGSKQSAAPTADIWLGPSTRTHPS